VASRQAPFKRHITAAGGVTVIATADTGTIVGITDIGVTGTGGTTIMAGVTVTGANITAGATGIGGTNTLVMGIREAKLGVTATTRSMATTHIAATTITIPILSRPIAGALFRPTATASACAGGDEIRPIAKTKRRGDVPALLF
jgi:hypothetical protein